MTEPITYPGNGAGPHVHIMAVPSREEHVDRFIEQWSPHGTVTAWYDHERNGILWNHQRILHGMASGDYAETAPGWHTVLADDVDPCGPAEKAAAHLTAALRFAPNVASFLSPTHTSGYTKRLVKRRVPYGVGYTATWGAAMCFRTEVLPTHIALVDDVRICGQKKHQQWDDWLPDVHNVLHGTRSAVTARAIFAHKDLPSTVGHLSAVHRTAEVTVEDTDRPHWAEKTRAIWFGPRTPLDKHRELAQIVTDYREGHA